MFFFKFQIYSRARSNIEIRKERELESCEAYSAKIFFFEREWPPEFSRVE